MKIQIQILQCNNSKFRFLMRLLFPMQSLEVLFHYLMKNKLYLYSLHFHLNQMQYIQEIHFLM